MLAQLHKDFRFQRDLILVRRWQRLLTVRIRFLYTTKNSRDLRWDSFWLFVCFFFWVLFSYQLRLALAERMSRAVVLQP